MNTRTKTKTYRKSAMKERFDNYLDAVQEAYNCGYRDGCAAYERIPKVRGAYTAATYGYGRGLKKYKQYNRKQAKSRKK